jgi:cytochrome c2
VFTSNCGSCHTLAAAGTTGQIGPNLDQVSLTATQVASQVRQFDARLRRQAERCRDPSRGRVSGR